MSSTKGKNTPKKATSPSPRSTLSRNAKKNGAAAHTLGKNNNLLDTQIDETAVVDISSRDESSELKNNTNVTVSAPATPEPESTATSPQTKKRTADDAALEVETIDNLVQRAAVHTSATPAIIQSTSQWLRNNGFTPSSLSSVLKVASLIPTDGTVNLAIITTAIQILENEAKDPEVKRRRVSVPRVEHNVQEIEERILANEKLQEYLPKGSFVVRTLKEVFCTICCKKVKLREEGNLSRLIEHVVGKQSAKRKTLSSHHKTYFTAKKYGVEGIGPKCETDRNIRRETSKERKKVQCYCLKPASIVPRDAMLVWQCAKQTKPCNFARKYRTVTDYNLDSDDDSDIDDELDESVTA